MISIPSNSLCIDGSNVFGSVVSKNTNVTGAFAHVGAVCRIRLACGVIRSGTLPGAAPNATPPETAPSPARKRRRLIDRPVKRSLSSSCPVSETICRSSYEFTPARRLQLLLLLVIPLTAGPHTDAFIPTATRRAPTNCSRSSELCAIESAACDRGVSG